MSAPHITPQDIEDNIVHEHYFTADEGAHGAAALNEGSLTTPNPELKRLTICVLTLKNGFMVTGESACVHIDNFNRSQGCQIARAKAVEKVWGLMGYVLRNDL